MLESLYDSKRPKDGPFFQQNLPAWKPILTARKCVPIFTVIGFLFIPIGIILIVTSNNVSEIVIDYTTCISKNDSTKTCADFAFNGASCVCQISFILKDNITGPVFLYYELSNFYQNHRRYLRSKDDYQLLGVSRSVSDLSACEPFAQYSNGSVVKPILPCGAIANSLFNDTFSLTMVTPQSATSLVMDKTGIAWSTDKQIKYGLLPNSTDANTYKPFNWPVTELQRSPGAFISDEELMVWMRASALPYFRKLHRRNVGLSSNTNVNQGLPNGNYSVEVIYNFPVSVLGARKRLVLSNMSWMGGKNITLGVVYLVTGCVHLILAVFFAFIHARWVTRSFFTLTLPVA